jgi:hypothetical protein
MSALSTNDIIDVLLALLDELARRLDPDLDTVDELRQRLDALRTN